MTENPADTTRTTSESDAADTIDAIDAADTSAPSVDGADQPANATLAPASTASAPPATHTPAADVNGADDASPEADGHPDEAPQQRAIPRITLGFARGVAPAKWERRWRAAATGQRLDLVPLALAYGDAARGRAADETAKLAATCDVVIMRTAPGARPEGTAEAERTRHALHLYTEAVALVVSKDHELAKEEAITLTDLEFVTLLDHPDHPEQWPTPQRWEDPSWMPSDIPAALRLVATGAGAILLPLPLARHLTTKREHAVLPIRSGDSAEQQAIAAALPGSEMWATWAVDRDAADLQMLAGVLRGRTARSSRTDAQATETDAGSASRATATAARAKRPAAKKALKPNSRGAQLAASREKAERKKAEARQAKRRKRR